MAYSSCESENYHVLVSIQGIVVHGKGLGHFLGIPTANIDSKQDISFLQEGVYCSKIFFDDVAKCGTVNIGRRPTVDNLEKFTIEVNILDFNEDIYDKFVTLEVYKLLRPTQKFDSLSHLIRQIRTDSISTLKFFGQSLQPNGIDFDLERSVVLLNGSEFKLEEKALSLVFLLSVNHSCSFTCHQLYEAIWHEVNRADSEALVLALVEHVNEVFAKTSNTQVQTQLVRVVKESQSEEKRIQLLLHS